MTTTNMTLHPGQPGAIIHPNIYGHFAEHLGRCIYGGIWVGENSTIPHDGGIRLDTVEALRRLELPVLRWPGGCFADNYHWRDGIGPRDQRPTRLNIWWLQGESNAFGTHEFMRFCRMIGTEPYLCANVGSGTVEEARSWMEYCNARQDTTLTRERAAHGDPAPFNVKYWAVGNENWGCGGKMTPEFYGNLYRQYATYLRRSGGPVTLVACGHDADWNERLLRTLKGAEGLLDAIALHYYSAWGQPDVDFSDEDYFQALTQVAGMHDTIYRAGQLCRAHSTAGHAIKVILDEWGTWYREATTERGLYQQNTMRDAVFTAMSFHMFHRHAGDLVMTNMAQTVNVLQALVLTEGPRLCVTPTYWVYDLFKSHRGGQVVPLSLDGSAHTLADGRTVPLTSASASVQDGVLTLSLVNAALEGSTALTITVDGGVPGEILEARLLTTAQVRDYNTPENPEVIVPAPLAVGLEGGQMTLSLPPHAIGVVRCRFTASSEPLAGA